MRGFFLAILLSAPILLSPSLTCTATAQAPDQARLHGSVLDATRAPIAGAIVSASTGNTAQPAWTTTNGLGEFDLRLAPGQYTLSANAPGFLELSRQVPVSSGDPPTIDFVLQVAGITDSVTVNGVGPYTQPAITTATRTATRLLDVPQSVTVVTKELMQDQLMMSVGDVMRYVPGVSVHQGENNRDQIIVRGNSSSADFYIDGVRDDVQYYRDLYNTERIEALKGPNAMIFGRGGAGGVVNRVMKDAGFRPLGEISLQGGMHGNKRVTGDFGRPVSEKLALRINGMFEDSDSFRDHVTLNRKGLTPTVTFEPTRATTISARYEYLDDSRIADRGITSYQGRPANVPDSTYYGDPDQSHVQATVNLASGLVEHRRGAMTVRNHTLMGMYDRSYQNFVPGAVTPNMSQVALSAYNNATQRTNFFNQTDVTYTATTGWVRHTLLAGTEFGLQGTDNFRNTGYFNNAATTVLVPFSAPTISTPVTFRQGATDADNHLDTKVAAAYVQDQAELSSHLQVVGGLRFDRFDLTYHNNRNGDELQRVDDLVSPRLGVVIKPIEPMSIYSTYSVSYLPSSGDQFSSLTVITEQVKPEKMTNYEVGAKWDLRARVSAQAAVYRLDRTNTRSTDPKDPTRIAQTGSQRTNGFELGINGSPRQGWKIAGGYAYQDAFVTSATVAAAAGAQVAQVPHHSFSLWNYYQITPQLSGGLGLLQRSDTFATIDNSVTLDGYTRADAAVYFSPNGAWRLQANVENLLGTRYYTNADSNTNISPGFPRTLRLAVTTTF